MKVLVVFLSSFFSFQLLFAHFPPLSDSMPIIAYMGVPDWQTSDSHFSDLSQCGFTVSLYPYVSLPLLQQACRSAHKYGVRVIGRCPEMIADPTATARTLSAEPGFFGYFIDDEPPLTRLPQLRSHILSLRVADSTHCFYLNLLPCYDTIQAVTDTQAPTYDRYLHAAADLPTQQISFDYYPVTTGGIRTTWYANLEAVRRQSFRTRKPFWGFLLSVPHAVYPMPTLSSLRLQAYTNLAYGAQALQYFTYWNPGPDEGFDYHDAPVTRQGEKTATYTLVQSVNTELRPVADLFFHANVTQVAHLGRIPNGTKRLNAAPLNFKTLKVRGREGAIVSQFSKDGHTFLAVVNKSLRSPMTLSVTLSNGKPRRLTKTLQEETVKSNYTLPPGDILLFRLQ